MDLLAHLLVRNGEIDPAVARSILEARLYIGPFVAELAARRAGADLRSQLDPALAALRHAQDAVARQRASLEFWDVIVDGADSITFRLMYNGLRAAYEPALAALAPLLDAEVSLGAYERLAAAITKGQPANARRTADDLLRPGSLSLLAALDALEAP
jgi:DNA-binding FadR family transcriptional regulator